MRHLPHPRRGTLRPLSQTGFTLVELMVAMLLGLITVLVVSQVPLQAEGRKRTTTSGSDATVTGAMALYTIERDARNAGFGMTTNPAALGCTIKAYFKTGPTPNFILAPVSITQGGTNGEADSIEFMASTKEGIPLPTKVTDKHNQTDAQFQVESRLGLSVNDLMIAVPEQQTSGTWCSMFQVTDLPGNSDNVIHNNGQSDYNPPGGATIFPPGGYTTGSSLVNLGTFSRRRYSIANNGLNLSRFDMLTGTNTAPDLLYPQVIQLQAEYGIDATPADNTSQVSSWSTATPTDWRSVKAIRVAVVARSNVYEKEAITISSSDADCADLTKRSPRAVCWAGGAITQLNTNPDDANEWQHYRYRVYEAIIPIRNVIWQQ